MPCAFYAAALALTMAAVQPALTALSVLAALAHSAQLRGVRQTVRSLWWQVPMVLVVAVANPLFSASGSTELFRIGLTAVYLESLCYGLTMGLLLMAVIAWFGNASAVLTSDKVMAVLGGRLPVVSLMLSMTLRLVPRFVRRGREIALVHAACTGALAPCEGERDSAERDGGEPAGSGLGGARFGKARAGRKGAARRRLSARLRQVSVLMGWSMEDSLETADAMRARGWDRRVRRTRYRRDRFDRHDALLACMLAVLAGVAVAVAWTTASHYRFYPTMSVLRPWWGYAAYALFLAYPFIVQGEEALRWRR